MKERDWPEGPESLTATPAETGMYWSCTKSCVGESSFPTEACQAKPLSLPGVRPEKSHIGFVFVFVFTRSWASHLYFPFVA